MKKSDLIDLIGIIVSIIGIIITIISIRLTLLGGSQGNCNIGNITAGDGADVNISCTVAP